MATKQKKSTTNKKTAPAKKKTAAAKPAAKALPEAKPKKPSVVAPWVLGLLAALIILTFFIEDTGFFGAKVRPMLRGLFGGGVFVLPFYLLIIAVFWKRDHTNKYSASKYALCIANWIFVSILIQMLTADADQRAFWQGKGNPWWYFLNVFYENGKSLIGAGAIGGTVGTAFESFIGRWASIILSFPLAAISLLFICGTTPGRMIKRIVNLFRDLRLPSDVDDPADMPAAAPQKAERPAREKRTRETEKQKKPVDIPIDAPAPEEAPPSRVDVPIPEEDRPFDYKQIFAEEDSPAPYAPQPAPVRTDADLREEAELDLNAEDMRPDEPETPEREQLGTSADAAPPYVFPPLTLLTEGTSDVVGASPADITRTSEKLVETLASFGVRTRIINTSCGPSVTRYELQPESGVKVKAIANLADDIALHLAATSIRMECPIPGKSAVGIELPNKTVTTVRLRDLIANSVFRDSKEKLLVCLGVDIGGNPVYLNIAKMPHLLVAGATGMGKSVCINSMIVSLLYHAKPDEVKLILIDPKKIEFSDYNGIPHLLVPVVTEPKKAAGTLNVAVNEMEKRFSLFAEVGARELSEYNDAIRSDPEREQLPSIVIIIDELADLMMVVGKDVEDSICRIAQKARAAGMHLIVATQRPSVDVITGLIKANIPSRIAFAVSSQVDSRTILDGAGAEKLLGMGDMLFMPVGAPKPTRIQGTFVRDEEISRVLDFIKKSATVQYDEAMIEAMEKHAIQDGKKGSGSADSDEEGGSDPMLKQAVEVVIDAGQASTSLLQRRCKLGYARAARIMDEMEEKGIIGPYEGAKPRAVLISRQQWLEMQMNQPDE